MDEPTLDCLIIGGGPAGLTAAIYLARFHLDILVVDGGKSRAALDPLHPQPCRLSGRHQRQGAARSGCASRPANTARRSRPSSSPSSSATSRPVCSPRPGARAAATARTVLLATGVTNRRPPMDEELHDEALARGLIRYCPICDGYEVTDKKVGVIGSDSHGVAEALFLRSYTADVTLIAPGQGAAARRRGPATSSRTPGSTASTGPPRRSRSPGTASSSTPPKGTHSFDSVYPALGSDTHTQLAEMVGARAVATMAASRSTATSAPACPAFMPPATW